MSSREPYSTDVSDEERALLRLAEGPAPDPTAVVLESRALLWFRRYQWLTTRDRV